VKEATEALFRRAMRNVVRARFVRWYIDGTLHQAEIDWDDQLTIGLVSFPGGKVIEDLSLTRYDDGTWALVGSRVRSVVGDENARRPPDVFRLAGEPGGPLELIAACDSSGRRCAPLQVIEGGRARGR
jgi:hypothetical protein